MTRAWPLVRAATAPSSITPLTVVTNSSGARIAEALARYTDRESPLIGAHRIDRSASQRITAHRIARVCGPWHWHLVTARDVAGAVNVVAWGSRELSEA